MPLKLRHRDAAAIILAKWTTLSSFVVHHKKQNFFFYVALTLLSLASLWPIWTNRFLPMQDYPQHLFLAKIMATYHDSSYNYKEFYSIDIGLRPYMLWYLAMKMLATVSSVETAGKILFSLYILLITRLVLAARRLAWSGTLPWGGLLLFPFAFNQMYFMGFPNYIISLPLIFLALLDLDTLVSELSVVALARHAIYLFLLFLIHPYSLLVYIALSCTSAYFVATQRPQLFRTLLPAFIMCFLFAVWYLGQHRASTSPTSVPWTVHWLAPNEALAYYLLQFTGMRLVNGVHWLTLGIWGGIAVLLDIAHRRRSGRISKRLLAWFFVSLAGVFVLPFWMGYYTYFNVRLAPVSYFAFALLICGIRLSWRQAMVLTVCILMLVVQSIRLQKSVALEMEAILPLVGGGQKNSLVLPMLYQTGSNNLDLHFFYQMHSHDPDYFQMLVGGGATPTLFPNAMIPVQYRSSLILPYPMRPEDFSWSLHGAYYDYIITREAPRHAASELAKTCDLIARSGPWALFKNRSARKSL